MRALPRLTIHRLLLSLNIDLQILTEPIPFAVRAICYTALVRMYEQQVGAEAAEAEERACDVERYRDLEAAMRADEEEGAYAHVCVYSVAV